MSAVITSVPSIQTPVEPVFSGTRGKFVSFSPYVTVMSATELTAPVKESVYVFAFHVATNSISPVIGVEKSYASPFKVHSTKV